LINRLKAVFNPEQYHGWNKSKNYFEGWYFKLVSKDGKHAFAVIPGVAMSEDKSHSFIQVLDGRKKTATYHTFDTNEFKPTGGKFEVEIGDNYFSKKHIKLNLPDFKAELNFENQVPWPSSIVSPNIMGPFTFAPFMQCYHGILSMNHQITGKINSGGKEINYDHGKGYMEKDWGVSFPSAYIWMQSNHFSKENISIKSSVANVPFLGRKFVGCIAGVYLGDRIIQFTTYNLSKLRKIDVSGKEVNLTLSNLKHELTIKAIRSESTELASPINGFMDGKIEESMEAEIHVKLIEKKSGKILLEDIGYNAGLEVAGNIDELLLK